MNLLSFLHESNKNLISCRKCERLCDWREQVSLVKKKSFLEDVYWGKPVPHFGEPEAQYLIIGLAPAAHGANRTGRMFTGDRSGDWLFRSLFKAGIANQPNATSISDNLTLKNTLVSAVVHCAPPDNKPTPTELEICSQYLVELLKSRHWRSILCLGGISWRQTKYCLSKIGESMPEVKFAHLACTETRSNTKLIGCYHPSQQNTFTGRLTESMLDSAIALWQSF